MKSNAWNLRLQPKLLLGLIGMAIILTAVLVPAIAMTYRGRMEHYYSNLAFQQAEIAARLIDGDRARRYYQTGEKDAYYEQARQQLLVCKQSMGLKYFYVVVPEEDYMVYLWDAGEQGEEGICDLGDTDRYYGDGCQRMHDAFSSSAEQKILITRSQEYGYLASAYVPILDSAGQPAALASVDISMDLVNEQIRQFELLTLLIICGVLAVSCFAYYFYIQHMLIRPLGKLHQAELELVEHKMDRLDTFSVDIRTGDELQDLAQAFQFMTRELSRYIQNLSRITAEKERISAELNVATQIQADMLPSIFPAFPSRKEFDLYAAMDPAKEVGGDFYDFFLVDQDHLAAVIADVSGKGVPAALFMVIAKTLIKNHAQSGMEPCKVFETVNNQLCENNEAGMFVTAFLGILEISTGRFTYVNAGHNPPLIAQSGRPYEWLAAKPNFILAGIEQIHYCQQELVFHPGDRLFLYTDGVTEALNPAQELYSERRLQAFWNQTQDLQRKPLEEQLHLLRRDIEVFVSGAEQADDITMLLLQINGPDR